MYNTAPCFIPYARYRVGTSLVCGLTGQGLSREVLRTLIVGSTGSNWRCPDTAMVVVVRRAGIRQ
mgnify:CR=1 FL=1